MSEPQPDPKAAVVPIADAERTVSAAISGRFSSPGRLRERTAHGVIVNAAFQVGFAALGLVHRFAAAAFLTTTEFGIWGLVLTTVLTLSFLKQIGISDKYIQQDDEDQELAFQKAFSLELAYSSMFTVLVIVVLPVYGLIYGEPSVVLPAMVLALILMGSALSAPLWIPLRRMQFARQRMLESVNPIVSTVVMVSLAIAGAGYWALIAGVLAGTYVAAIVAWISCPYKIALRFDKATLREYIGFSWPLLLAGGSGLLVVQGTMLVANYSVGLSGVGAIALAGSVIVFAQRVDSVINRTIYPAVCTVQERTEVLYETFVKSNRLALMLGVPFGVGLALFTPDLVEFVLGARWEPAEPLLVGLGLLVAIRQVGFNWSLFFQATGNTRPMAIGGAVSLFTFVVGVAPAIILWGLPGYVAGMGVALLGELGVRGYFLRQIFDGFKLSRHLMRGFLPTLPAVVGVLAARALGPADRSLELFAGELTGFLALFAVTTLVMERRLLREVLGYVRGTEDHPAPADAVPTAV